MDNIFCYLSSCTRRRQVFFSKALVYYCFLVFRRFGEYISIDLFYFVNLTSSSLNPQNLITTVR